MQFIRAANLRSARIPATTMREETRIKMAEVALTTVGTVGILGVLALILSVAFKYFEGWRILGAIAAELALLVVIYHLYRWFRYPGLFASKSFGRLICEVLLSIVFIYSLPLIAILAKLHVAGLLPLDTAACKLGLEFKFKKRELVRVSADARTHAGEVGRVVRVEVATENTLGQVRLRTGEVIYSVIFPDGILVIPERHLSRMDSALATPGFGRDRDF